MGPDWPGHNYSSVVDDSIGFDAALLSEEYLYRDGNNNYTIKFCKTENYKQIIETKLKNIQFKQLT